MELIRKSRRVAGWLAVLAMSLNALWPLVANAKPAWAFDPSIEICTVGGATSIGGGEGAPQPSGNAHQPNCSFCTLSLEKSVMPAQPVGVALAISEPARLAAQFLQQCPSQSLIYSISHPRDPPVLS
jgi:hypothetical protein